jgi:hypothetical protein
LEDCEGDAAGELGESSAIFGVTQAVHDADHQRLLDPTNGDDLGGFGDAFVEPGHACRAEASPKRDIAETREVVEQVGWLRSACGGAPTRRALGGEDDRGQMGCARAE